MYLKEIVTSGFKSFADKLNIKLDGKITCIVGPNGSGKSNVVDAVRWVLGEQSVKSLRGEGSMSEVIFSGSKSRNPLNVATVELIFDNSDHFLTVPYTEISIKRRVYRSGENEYYLNIHKKLTEAKEVDGKTTNDLAKFYPNAKAGLETLTNDKNLKNTGTCLTIDENVKELLKAFHASEVEIVHVIIEILTRQLICW